MSDAIVAIVAQKLIKRLCPACKEVGPPTPAEVKLLLPFTDDVPAEVARPKGCPACRDTGYRGREGVYEILHFDPDVSRMVRDGAPISEIRSFCATRGDYLIGRHALDKVRDLVFAVGDVHEQVLLEELMFMGRKRRAGDGEDVSSFQAQREGAAAGVGGVVDTPGVSSVPAGAVTGEPPVVLVVDDDEDLRALVELYLKGAGYRVELACDGVEALLSLAQKRYDLVLSDINMPNLDGEKLIEMITQKGIDVPTIFLTGEEDDELEARVLTFGAVDYIRKPVRKDVLLLRMRRALPGRVGVVDDKAAAL
jgi:CheY-like chemotaxis protein